jgi:quercetin dioxygenase-like cupin family protein
MEAWRLDREPARSRRPRVLRSDAGANRVILLALAAGDELAEHEVREHALVFLIDGETALSAANRQEILTAPALVHLNPSERHAVQAHSDSRLVICLAPW